MDHTISILVENEFGVLARIAGLFSGRGFNIESLTVAKTLDPSLARITLVTNGDDQIVEQITKQLNKLICVIKVVDFKETPYVEREMALVKVTVDERIRSEVLNIANIFRAKVIDVDPRSYVIEITGDDNKISAFINLLKPLGIKEIVRTGKVAIQRGTQVLLDSSRGEVVELKGKAKKEKVS
ncbi:MAG: acetolactate synthase small subunit [Deltaproteobacteria bacterium]|nr:acetolactate synthase small subunit [Deltaproteobacteria bacterium]